MRINGTAITQFNLTKFVYIYVKTSVQWMFYGGCGEWRLWWMSKQVEMTKRARWEMTQNSNLPLATTTIIKSKWNFWLFIQVKPRFGFDFGKLKCYRSNYFTYNNNNYYELPFIIRQRFIIWWVLFLLCAIRRHSFYFVFFCSKSFCVRLRNQLKWFPLFLIWEMIMHNEKSH